ncbi:MAG: MFS transporter [Actinomycetota bacterium]|nr:MFS transporter [Acidimicrobiales bacterium]
MNKVGNSTNKRFPAFTSTNFCWLFANSVFTTGSRWAQILGRGWLVHNLSGGSTTAVGWVTFASFFPFVIVGPIAGALADRFDRRKILICGGIFGVLGASVLAVATAANVIQVWQVGVLAFATGCAQAIAVPTRQALIANVVPTAHLTNAIAISATSQQGSRLLGPLFGAVFLETLGAGAVFAVAAILLALGVYAATRLQTASDSSEADSLNSPPSDKGSINAFIKGTAKVGEDLASALRYVKNDRRILVVIALVGAHCSFTMAFDSMMPLLSDQIRGSSSLYSSVLIGLGAGAVAGTLNVSQIRTDRARSIAFIFAGVGSGLAMVCLGVSNGVVPIFLASILAGWTQGSYMALSATLVQQVVDDRFRGRVMSFYIMIAAGHMALINLAFGQLAEFISVRALLIVPGLIWIGIFLMSSIFSREARHVIRRGTFSSR